MSKIFLCLTLFSSFAFAFGFSAAAQQNARLFSGTILTQQFEVVPNVTVEVRAGDNNKLTATSDAEGKFSLQVPRENFSVQFSGNNISSQTRIFSHADNLENLQIKVVFEVAPVHETVVIEDDTLSPEVEFRNSLVYENTLFSRDDQLLQNLNAGINAGQHEGGGKSLEIRRFGFNLDHGGVNGGLKILVDDVQQNQGTQGHGQGYLGSLKSLSPELVQDVSILNGPFSAQYGDFSGLGVVHIRQKESLPQTLTLRLQGGRFDTFRTFLAYSPQIKNVDSFVAYEGSRTDGPFINPLDYKRDNFTGNFTRKTGANQSFGFKFNGGRNLFTSSGQIPLDLVERGELDRFGFVDPENGGKVFQATGAAYYRKEFESGRQFKADAFVTRSLFDLWSNFTFNLKDPINGDEIQQHDSRLVEGANAQFLQPYKFGENQSLLTIGGNFHASQINVGLYPSIMRNPNRKSLPENRDFRDVDGDRIDDVLLTSAGANVNNYAAYIQNGADFFNGHLHVEAGLRFDTFTFDVNGFESRDENNQLRILNGKQTATAFQPKLSAAWSPFERFPTVFYANYGRGISSQDARGTIKNPDSPKISTTDFYQTGAAYNSKRFSIAGNFFFIDRSNEQVYIPDDGSIEFAGRSRSYGFELKNSIRFNRFIGLNAGLTQVIRAFYPGDFFDSDTNSRERIIIDSAPRTVANGGLTFSEFRGFNSSIVWRHISSYRLDAEDATVRASGHDVVDFNVSKRIKRWVDLDFSLDNVLNKRFFETQNYFESRLLTDLPVGVDPETGRNIYPSRIHATPGYPVTFTIGATFRLFTKE